MARSRTLSVVLLTAGLLWAMPASAQTAPVLTRIDQIAPAFEPCWDPPPGLRALEGIAVTARFSLRRDGSLLGDPMVTFSTADVAIQARQLLTQSAVEAIRTCTPLKISLGLGQAIAGRPFAIRFIYKGPQGRGA
jgi:hypothetical protein